MTIRITLDEMCNVTIVNVRIKTTKDYRNTEEASCASYISKCIIHMICIIHIISICIVHMYVQYVSYICVCIIHTISVQNTHMRLMLLMVVM